MSDKQLRSLSRSAETPEEKAKLLVARMRVQEQALIYPGGKLECSSSYHVVNWGPYEDPCIECGTHLGTVTVEPLYGPMNRERVELAAFLGDEAARIALGWPAGTRSGFWTAGGRDARSNPEALWSNPRPLPWPEDSYDTGAGWYFPSLSKWITDLQKLAKAWGHDGLVMVRANAAAGWVVADSIRIRSAKNPTHMERSVRSVAADECLELADIWADAPCHFKERELAAAHVNANQSWLVGAHTDYAGSINDAALHVGPRGGKIIRKAIRDKLVPWVLAW